MKTLDEFFEEQGYRLYICSMDQRYMSFVQEESYSVNIICFYDERQQTSTRAQMESFEEVHRSRLDYGRDKDIHFLRLICTNAMGVGRIVPGTDPRSPEEEEGTLDKEWIDRVWYLIDDHNTDPETGEALGVRLFVPPEASEDFYGIRRHLEAHVAEEGVQVQLPELNLDAAEENRSELDRAPAEQGPDGRPILHSKKKAVQDAYWMTLALVLLNVLMYILSDMKVFETESYGLSLDTLSDPSQWYRLLTYMFLHASLSHIFSNMLMLYAVGSVVEPVMNKGAYLALYFVSGLCGGLLSVWMQMRVGEDYSSIGASGAIYGIVGGLIAWMLVAGKWRSPRLYSRIVIALILMFYGSSSMEGVDYMDHLGGFVGGLLFTGIYILITWKGKKALRNERKL